MHLARAPDIKGKRSKAALILLIYRRHTPERRAEGRRGEHEVHRIPIVGLQCRRSATATKACLARCNGGSASPAIAATTTRRRCQLFPSDLFALRIQCHRV